MPLGPLGTNCYIVSLGKEALVFDPGGNADELISYLKENDLNVRAILLTHAHFDHIGAVEELRTNSNADVYIHDLEAEWLEDPNLNRSVNFTGEGIVVRPAEHMLTPGEMKLGSFSFEVIHTPGHSPGSVSFLFQEHQFVISGDVLFNQGIGRTDLPGGDFVQLEASIRNHLYQLDDEFTVYPGHGPKTTILNEKKNNPFIRI